jgi:hypothetical protein
MPIGFYEFVIGTRTPGAPHLPSHIKLRMTAAAS